MQPFFKLFHVLEDLVFISLFDLLPYLLSGVEFWTVWRYVDKPNVVGDGYVFCAVESCIVYHQHLLFCGAVL